MKKTWEGINSLINRKRNNHKIITTIKCPTRNEINRNPRDIPNILNKHFSTIGTSLASKLPNPIKHFSQYLDTTNYSGSFFFDPISPHEVECEISSMSCAKAYGLYSCPIRILKYIKHQISWPLSEIMNISIEKGVFPSKFKHAKVIPIFKDDDETDPGNYRPISLLSNLNQIFEKLMSKRLKTFFDKNKTLYHKQWSCLKVHTSDHE